MAKNTINILCPSGHRRKAQMTPNSNLLQFPGARFLHYWARTADKISQHSYKTVLEDMCNEETLDSSEWGLIYQRNKCDLNSPWRLQSIPTNAVLEMYKLEERRQTDDINVQLQLPDNSRYSGWFEPTVTLQEMLDWYRFQPESMVAALDISLGDNFNSCPICSYMSEEIIGDYALSNTTLRELGLTSGTAVIRYNLRPVTDDELQKINGRIDEKIVRRRQQKYEQEQKSKQPQPQPQQQQQQQQKPTTNPTPAYSSPSSTSNPSRSLMNSSAPSSNDEEHSIFRDPPPSASLPTTTRSQRQSRTLAEELGINLSLDLEPKIEQRQHQSQTDFRNFKFPEATKGKDLYQNEFDDDYRRAQAVKPCDRHLIAYDLVKNRPTRENQNKRSEELPDSFFEITADDLRSVLNTLQQESAAENPLETRNMRDRAQSARNVVYEQIAIRFVVDTRYVLQGLFRPEEPLSRLIDFARTTLICPHIEQKDFYLYTSPPRVVLSDLRKPLLAYDLAPAAFVYLGHRTVSPLNVQLASNIPIRTIDEANQLAAQYVFSRSRPMNEREHSTLYNERPMSATSLITRPTPRNPPASTVDDKQLREKLRKFLPGKK